MRGLPGEATLLGCHGPRAGHSIINAKSRRVTGSSTPARLTLRRQTRQCAPRRRRQRRWGAIPHDASLSDAALSTV